MPEWTMIDLSESEAVRLAQEKGSRLEVYWTEFDTSDEQDREYLLHWFMVRPLESLTGVGELAVPGLAIDDVGPGWKIVTTIHNHHRGLNPRITRVMATVSDDEETVYLDAHKQNK